MTGVPSVRVTRAAFAAGFVALGLGCTSTPAPKSGPDAQVSTGAVASAPFISATDPRVSVLGRVEQRSGRLRFSFPGVTFKLRFTGSSLSLHGNSSGGKSLLDVSIDGGEYRTLIVPLAEASLTLAEGLGPGVHDATVVHKTETWIGIVEISGWGLAAGGTLEEAAALPSRRLLFVGDSVTCGEAVEREPGCQKNPRWWNPRKSYGMLAAEALGAQVELVCFGGRGLVRDWEGRTDRLNVPEVLELTVPEDASSARWDHGKYPADAVVISVGTNDFYLALGALPERERYVSKYVELVRRVREVYPKSHVFLTEGSIVNDATDPARPQKTVLVSYIEETVKRLGDSNVHQVRARYFPGDECDPHPTAPQHAEMATDVVTAIRPVLGW